MSDAYTKGFNEGYVLAGHLPELARDLSKIESPSPRMEGFRDGRRQYVVEKTKGRQSAWLETGRDDERQADQVRGRTQQRSRDDRDAER